MLHLAFEKVEIYLWEIGCVDCKYMSICMPHGHTSLYTVNFWGTIEGAFSLPVGKGALKSGRLWGIQMRPFGVHETYLRNINFHFLKRPHAALPFSCTRRIAGAGAGGGTR